MAINIPAKGSADPDLITLATEVKGVTDGLEAGTSITDVNGVAMPEGGSLTVGTVLRATAGDAAAYGAVDLANASAVTGVLPGANVAAAVASVSAGTISGANQAKLEGIEALADVTDFTNVNAALAAADASIDVNVQSVIDIGALTFAAANATHVIGAPAHATAAGNPVKINGQQGAATFDGGDVVLTVGAKGAGGSLDGGISLVHPGDGEFFRLYYDSAVPDVALTTNGNVLNFESVFHINLDAMNDVYLKSSGSMKIEIGATGIGVFGHAQAAQQSDIGALTDNSAGTANTTIEAMPDPADSPFDADALRDDIVTNLLPAIRNNVADLAAQVNAIRAVFRAYGWMA